MTFRPTPSIWPSLGIAGVFLLACLVPTLVGGQPYVMQIVTLALCTAVPAMGLNLLFGYTGLVSLGQMGFAGAGGYAAALLLKAGWGFLPGLGASVIVAGLLGLVVGGPCLRLRSHFFIIVTLAVGLVLHSLFNNLDAITGGPAGLPGIPRPPALNLGFTVLDSAGQPGSTGWHYPSSLPSSSSRPRSSGPISAASSWRSGRTSNWPRRVA